MQKENKLHDRWVLSPYCEWSQVGKQYNWYTFTFVHVEFENDTMTKGYEFTCILLGIGFTLRYNTDDAFKLFDEWDQECSVAAQEAPERTKK